MTKTWHPAFTDQDVLELYVADGAGNLEAPHVLVQEDVIHTDALAYDALGGVLFAYNTAINSFFTKTTSQFGRWPGATWFWRTGVTIPPFTVTFMASDATGGVRIGEYSPGEDFGMGIENGQRLLSYSPAGQYLGSIPMPPGTLRIGATGDIFLLLPFKDSADVGCGLVSPGPGSYTLLARLDSTGKCLWNKTFTISGLSFAVTKLDDVLIAGSFQGTVDLGGGPLTSSGDLDLVMAKFDTSGNHLWSEHFGAPGASLSAGPLDADAMDGAVEIGYLTGGADLGCGLLSASPGGNNVFIASFDTAGAVRWEKVFQNTGSFRAVADGLGGVSLVSEDLAFNLGNGPLLSTPGIALAKLSP